MALSNKCRKIALYVLPDETLNEAFLILLVAYATILSHLRSQAVSTTLIDLQDNETENYVFNNTRVNVRSVSNAVLWACQEQPHYKSLYIAALVLMMICNFASILSRLCRSEFCTAKASWRWQLLEILGGLFFNIGLLALVFSYDLSPWSCSFGSFGIAYTPFDESAAFKHDLIVVRFIKAAPFVSSSCFIIWIGSICVRMCWTFNCANKCKNIFKDRDDRGEKAKSEIINPINLDSKGSTDQHPIKKESIRTCEADASDDSAYNCADNNPLLRNN